MLDVYYPIVSVNGEHVAREEAVVSCFDRGFLVADGIFETLYVTDGVAIGLGPHLHRLHESARFMRLEGVPDRDALAASIGGLLDANGLGAAGGPDASVRLTISRGVAIDGPPTVIVFARHLTPAHLAKRTEGVVGALLPFTRHAVGHSLSQHKTLAYLASSLGQIELAARALGPRAEGFFRDGDGTLLEGTASNLFIVEGQTVVTPPLDAGLLPGTSRARVLALAAAAGLAVREARFDVARLLAADEAFITSSTLRVAPLVSLEGDAVGRGSERPVVARLQAAFDQAIAAEVAAARRG